MQELAPGIFVETGFRRITVGAILTGDGFVLIDTPPYPADARCWRDMLAAVADVPVRAIILTDCHRDRLLGNSWFDAPVIVAHDETVAYMRNLPAAFLETSVDALTGDLPERSTFSGVHIPLPTVGFSHRMQLRFGERVVPLLAMPGPTAGSLWVHLPEERILFTGDSIIVGQHPYISSATTKDWLESLTVLRRSRFAADTIVPGRGPVVDKSATEPISNYLRLARRRVQGLYRAGRPRADTSALVPELLDVFPCDDGDLERVQRRIKSGLDRIYEEFKSNDKNNESSER